MTGTGPAVARAAAPGDEERVAELIAGFRDWLGRVWPDDRQIRRQVEDLMGSPAVEFLLAVEGQHAVGVCVLTFRPSVWAEGKGVCCLEDLFVIETARGSGAGRALVDLAIARAAERSCYRIELDVNAENDPARTFYLSLGFTSLDETFHGENLVMRHPI